MTAVLGHSRRLYCRAFLAQRQDDWLEGLEGAFQHFGGLTEQVLCTTNLENLVLCTRISNPFSSDVFRSGFTLRR